MIEQLRRETIATHRLQRSFRVFQHLHPDPNERGDLDTRLNEGIEAGNDAKLLKLPRYSEDFGGHLDYERNYIGNEGSIVSLQ